MSRHRTLPADFLARVREVAIARRCLPSDKQLAAEGRVSVRTVQAIMHETFPRLTAADSDGPLLRLPAADPLRPLTTLSDPRPFNKFAPRT